MTDIQGKNWDLELPGALWAYRIAVKTGTQFSPYHLVYGKEAIMPIELEILSLRMLSKLMDEPPNYYNQRLLQLQELQLDRVKALEYYEQLKKKHIDSVNAGIKDKGINEGELVLRYNNKLDKTFQKKFQIKWEGPFKVINKFENGTFQLADLDGALHDSRVNGYRLKKYIARMMMVVKDKDLQLPSLVAPTLPVEEGHGFALNHLFANY